MWERCLPSVDMNSSIRSTASRRKYQTHLGSSWKGKVIVCLCLVPLTLSVVLHVINGSVQLQQAAHLQHWLQIWIHQVHLLLLLLQENRWLTVTLCRRSGRKLTNTARNHSFYGPITRFNITIKDHEDDVTCLERQSCQKWTDNLCFMQNSKYNSQLRILVPQHVLRDTQIFGYMMILKIKVEFWLSQCSKIVNKHARDDSKSSTNCWCHCHYNFLFAFFKMKTSSMIISEKKSVLRIFLFP